MGTLMYTNRRKVGIVILQNNLAVPSEINIISTAQQPSNPTTWFILLSHCYVCSQVEQHEDLLQQCLWRKRAGSQLSAPSWESG